MHGFIYAKQVPEKKRDYNFCKYKRLNEDSLNWSLYRHVERILSHILRKNANLFQINIMNKANDFTV
jgi:hypothetical protein